MAGIEFAARLEKKEHEWNSDNNKTDTRTDHRKWPPLIEHQECQLLLHMT